MKKVTMDIIIQTGFESITHRIPFQPQTMSKGKDLVTAGHVRDVKEFRQSGKSYLITSKVIRQASVSLPPYDTTLHINGERFIEKVGCTCVYNQSGKCKHVAALFYYINHEESLTKTSQEQQWGKPSARQFVKEKYSKGRNFEDMFPTKKLIDMPVKPTPSVDLEELVDESALKFVLVADKESDDFYEIKNLLSSLVATVDLNLKKEDSHECLKNFSIYNDEFEVYSKNYDLQDELNEFYRKNIMMSEEDVNQLCSITLNQSQCKEWYQARRFRLSASSNIHSIKTRTRKTIHKLVNDILYPLNIDNDSTNYGLSHEDKAKKMYEDLTACEVKKVGVIVNKNQPWLCASIDGVVIEDGCVIKIVEFKCPTKCKNQPVVDWEQKSCNAACLSFQDNEVKLKKSNPYFTQIQVQLYVTGMFICDLFIYSQISDGCLILPIHRDEEFLKEVILSAENFYFNYYLPATYVVFTKDKNKATNVNVGFFDKRSFTGVNIMNSLESFLA